MCYNDTGDQIISGGLDNDLKVFVYGKQCFMFAHLYT